MQSLVSFFSAAGSVPTSNRDPTIRPMNPSVVSQQTKEAMQQTKKKTKEIN